MTTRRQFLRTLALSAGGIALLGTELAKPRTYFLPPPGGWARGPTAGLYDYATYVRAYGVKTAFPELLNLDIIVWDWPNERWAEPHTLSNGGWREIGGSHG